MKRFIFLVIPLLLIGVGCQAPGVEKKQVMQIPPVSGTKPVVVNTATSKDQQVSLEVVDQFVSKEEGIVKIKHVETNEPRWVVVYADAGGRPTNILGQTLVQSTSSDVEVEIRVDQMTDRLFATLHDEIGADQVFEFPNNDLPTLQADGKVVIVTFQANKAE